MTPEAIAVKLAREEIADDEHASRQRNWRGSVRAYHLSRAVIALAAECERMRPVYEAADAWKAAGDEWDALSVLGGDMPAIVAASNRWDKRDDALKAAIDVARSQNEPKK